ncbi:hypothetical protein HPB49_004766 [Dermacentor silvarum]|uniref:Uncharacterized protein n=1 Tax=Dermacentor silvarum TaxID=543639 RepID=A0ACB8DBF5_DERSI|nr:hypothetical protein HPB49_004766 [Dermacentor silvarum]
MKFSDVLGTRVADGGSSPFEKGLREPPPSSAVLTARTEGTNISPTEENRFGNPPKNAGVLVSGASIPVSDQYRYLGVNFHASAVLFDKQDEHVRQASVRAANVLQRRSLWGCNKFILVRELWKAIHVSVLTFANAVICLSAETRQWLERGQHGVGRLGFGCHGRVAVEAIQGDLGWSSFEAREARSKAAYEGRLRLLNNERKFSLFTDPVQEDSERKWLMEVRTRVQEAETSMWQSTIDQKSSLALYTVHKTAISVERLYDNSVGSALLFETRAGALRTKVYRRCFDQSVDDSTVQCRACGDDEENIEHIVLRCDRLCPRQPEGITLPEALGFVEARNGQNTNVHPLSATSITKARLLKWWSGGQ